MKPRTVAVALVAIAAAALAARALVRPRPAEAPAERGGTASVRVFDDGTPAAGRAVVFHDAGGGVLAWTKTDAAGRASGPMTLGGMISAVYGTSAAHLVTVTAVEPGDALVIGEEEDEGGPGKTACIARVSVPPPPAKTARTSISLGVNATELVDPKRPQRASVLERFLVGGRFRVLAEAFDADDRPVAHALGWFEGCDRDAGGDAVDARLEAWSADYRTFSIALDGALPAGAKASATLALTPEGADAFVRAGRETTTERPTFAFVAPRALGTRGDLEIEVAYDERDHAVFEEKGAALGETMALDLRERLLPRVTDAVVEEARSARPVVRFRVDGSPARADAAVVRLAWPPTREHVWTVIAPPTTPGRIVLPALPDALASYRPGRDPVTVAAALVEASSFAGYEDVKKRGLEAAEQARVMRWSSAGDLDF